MFYRNILDLSSPHYAILFYFIFFYFALFSFILFSSIFFYFPFFYFLLFYFILFSFIFLFSDGITSVYTYTNIWDATKIFGCQCDEHYTGSDCSLQNCPVGDDPLTGRRGERGRVRGIERGRVREGRERGEREG